jgi:nitrogen fixation protein FixH
MKSKFNPWPYGVIGFFVLLICALAGVVVIAATHQETMVSENYYEQELKYQDQIDSAARAQKCGANIQVDAAAGKLLVTVPAEQVARKLSGTIDFYRPSSAALDQELSFAPQADGKQEMDVSKLAAGLWLVRVRWNASGQEYYLEQKITL